MSDQRPLTVAQLLFALILLSGLAVRLYSLGAVPLSEPEAEIALQARAFTGMGEQTSAGVRPLYAAFTGLLFFLFGESNFMARLLPALAGGLLVCAPWILSGRIGRPTALLASAGLAFDPLLVGVSRQVGGPMPALGILAAAFALHTATDPGARSSSRQVQVGVLAGLAALAGPAFWLGLVILLFYGLTIRGFNLSFDGQDDDEPQPPVTRRAGMAFGITLVLAGTLFLRAPEGVGAVAGSIPAFLLGWASTDQMPIYLMGIGVVGYLGLNAVFAVVHLLRESGRWQTQTRAAALLLLVSLVIVVLHPGRAVGDLAWAAVPMWFLTAAELRSSFRLGSERLYRPLILAAVLIVLLLSFWNNAAILTNLSPQAPGFWGEILVLAGEILLIGLTIALVGLGWDSQSAKTGTAWAVGLLLVFGMLSGFWGLTPGGRDMRSELWETDPGPGRVDLLEGTLNELGGWVEGDPYAMEVVIILDSAAARWALRYYPNVRSGVGLTEDELPGVILAASPDQDLRIASTYRGQDFTWRETVRWDQLDWRGWLRWLIFREAPAAIEPLVLWARADLFLAAEELALEEIFPPDSTDPEAEGEDDFIPLEDVEELMPDG